MTDTATATATAPSEQLADSPVRHLLAVQRLVEHLIETTPATWPGLHHTIPDTDGRCVVHYSAARGTAAAAAITAVDGALATWRTLLANAVEQQDRDEDRDHPGASGVLRGTRDGYPITIVVSLVGGGL
ncbi:hypothetical protein [Streptomonospora litoralis]|uniref:Uncharacterized protein n=1 Tax=Streptomonospora litoralis TaxID=2498135 RepID=A0A4V0ZJH3_9ACTN|nr:hypothetical protein [Streptomonospora litoralis]QBI53482.1 hypothetical protein EKD16_08440 [Streptomonospora litoralis]